MNPYNVNFKNLKISEEITDERELLKLKLASYFLKITSKMTTDEIILRTGIHKSDLSRIRTSNIKRYTVDKMILLLDLLGFSTKIEVKKKAS